MINYIGSNLIMLFVLALPLYFSWRFLKLVKYGKGFFKPNFERMTRMCWENHHDNTNWNAPFWRVVYYVQLFFFTFFCYAMLVMCYFWYFK